MAQDTPAHTGIGGRDKDLTKGFNGVWKDFMTRHLPPEKRPARTTPVRASTTPVCVPTSSR